jgi:hypothetical protein
MWPQHTAQTPTHRPTDRLTARTGSSNLCRAVAFSLVSSASASNEGPVEASSPSIVRGEILMMPSSPFRTEPRVGRSEGF